LRCAFEGDVGAEKKAWVPSSLSCSNSVDVAHTRAGRSGLTGELVSELADEMKPSPSSALGSDSERRSIAMSCKGAEQAVT